MKFRIAIQSIEGNKYKHEHNIMLESDSVDDVIVKIRNALDDEIAKRMSLFINWINQRQPDMYDRIMKETADDLINWKDKGLDISKKEFLQNEMYIE